MAPPQTRLARALLLALPLLLAALPHAAASLCKRSTDCADKRSCTLDYCEPAKNQCYNFPKPGVPCDAPATFHTIASLRSAVPPLSAAERLIIVKASIGVLRDVHPHRDLHLALRGVDPVPLLLAHERKLSADIAANRTALESPFDFHQRMITIFNMLDDLHTTYRAPPPLREALAVLPFSLRHYYTTDADGRQERRYVVTDVANDILIGNPAFAVGVRIMSFNYVDIDAAVQRSGADGVGANSAARICRGSRRLTRRFLRRQVAPKREFATVGFLAPSGILRYVNLRWSIAQFIEPLRDPLGDVAASGSALYASAFERAASGIVPKLNKMSDHLPTLRASADSTATRTELEVNPFVAQHLAGEVVETKYGKLGIIRMYDFNSFLFLTFLEQVLKLLMSMKDHAVVIDVRGNNGGIVYLAQMSIQFFTQKRVKPMLWSTRITETTAILENAISVKGKPILSKNPTTSFTESIRFGLRAGDQFSGAFSLISEALFQEYTGERYTREMYVLTDAETYSAGDVFAAAVQDNEAAFVIGEDETTGAGGSSTIVYSYYLARRCPDIFPPLPGDVDFALSLRRMNRVGAFSGIAVEHFGVTPNKRYYPTMRDRTQGDADLHEFLAEFISRRHNESRPAPSPTAPPPNTTIVELPLEPLPSAEP